MPRLIYAHWSSGHIEVDEAVVLLFDANIIQMSN